MEKYSVMLSLWRRVKRRSTVSTLGTLLILFVDAHGAGSAETSTSPDLQKVAVNIELTPVQSWTGYGIYLGNGLVITAAHVVGHAATSRPKVVYAGQRLATVPVKEGSFPEQDLTVLRIEDPLPPALAPLHTTVCAEAPQPDEAVLVSTPEKVTSSAITRPGSVPPIAPTQYVAASIKDVYATGNSGSGVFDAAHGCLLGIMSSKLEEKIPMTINGKQVTGTVGIAKHFVPAADIRAFVAGLPAF